MYVKRGIMLIVKSQFLRVLYEINSDKRCVNWNITVGNSNGNTDRMKIYDVIISVLMKETQNLSTLIQNAYILPIQVTKIPVNILLGCGKIQLIL